MLQRYRSILRRRSFRILWLGFTLSALGDAMTNVALTWFVYQQTKSAEALGWLAFWYMAPVVAGGLLAGPLLDRFDRRVVMLLDNVTRGLAISVIPLLHATGHLAVWHVYTVVAVYGLLMMISLAGVPSLIPALVPSDELSTANAAETLSFTLAGVLAPVIAGVLIPFIGAPNVVIVDALSYLAFALALARISVATEPVSRGDEEPRPFGDAVRLLLTNKILLSTTVMFLIFNIAGSGFLAVWLPILVDRVLGGGARMYGVLVGAIACGEVVSAFLAGSRTSSRPLGAQICLGQALSGVSLALVLASHNAWLVGAGLTLFGAFSAPLTIWAQTLRMQIIPEPLRGRAFALLRTIMQSGGPLGGVLAGALLPIAGLSTTIAISALAVGLPGVLAHRIDLLRRASVISRTAEL